MVHRLLLLAALVAAVLTASAQPAGAAPITTKKAMWGPVEVDGQSQFPIYADLGVGIYQTTVNWADVAGTRPQRPTDPSDPAYNWPAEVDQAIAGAAPYGIKVMVMLIGAPAWANGGHDEWRYAPRKPSDWADFVEAAARRWPTVHLWMVWSEPTKAQNFQPMVSDDGLPLRTARELRGPHLYARMLDASYSRLKRLSPANKVIGGNTFTVGTVRPLYFMRALRLPNGRPPRMDMWGHNPFSARTPNLAAPPLGSGYADFSDLDTLVRALDRNMRRATISRERKLKVFISEYSLPTDHENFEFNFYVTPAIQASWIRKAIRIVRGWSRIYTFGYLGLYDDGLRADNQQVERGLIQRDGTLKPAYAAFRDS
jgi:hypothetical protein